MPYQNPMYDSYPDWPDEGSRFKVTLVLYTLLVNIMFKNLQ